MKCRMKEERGGGSLHVASHCWGDGESALT